MSAKFSGLGLAVDSPTRMTILHPVTRAPLKLKDAEGKDTEDVAFIDLLSANSAIGRKHDRTVTDRLIKMRGRRPSAEELDSDTTDKLAVLTKGWQLATLDGELIEIECTTANARELFNLPEASWLREQVAEFVVDAGNLAKAPLTS